MAQNQTSTTTQNNKTQTHLSIIVVIVMALSLVALFVAFQTYLAGDIIPGAILAGIGTIALALAVFMLYQSRKQAAEIKIDIPKVMTYIECQNKGCASKTSREFQRGDYVFKHLEVSCSKCGGRQMVTAIYKEVKEKEKTYAV